MPGKFTYLQGAFFVVIALWYLGIIIPLFINNYPQLYILLPFLKITYSHICHQLPQKSFEIHGQHFLVCSRCFGIYTGMFIVSFAAVFINIKNKIKPSILILSALPMLADVILVAAGVYNYNKILSYLTGCVFGSVVFVYISNIVFESFFKVTNKDIY